MEDAAGAFALIAAANLADTAAAAEDSGLSPNGASYDGDSSNSAMASQANGHASSLPPPQPPSGMLGYELALARALAAAAEDVVLHVVQLNGRPLPPPHMLPPRLLKLNASLSSSPVSSSASAFTAAGERVERSDSAVFESGSSEPSHTRMVVLHDIWKLASNSRRSRGSDSMSNEWRAAKPPLETTAKHQEVIKHANAASRAASQLASFSEGNFNANNEHSESSNHRDDSQKGASGTITKWFNGLWTFFLGESSNTAENNQAQSEGSGTSQVILQVLHTSGRGVVVVVKFVAKVGWSCGQSLIFGTPLDWQWASRDGRRAIRKSNRFLKAWWAGLIGTGAIDQTSGSSSSSGRRTSSSSHDRSDSSAGNSGGDDDDDIDDDACDGSESFAGFGAGSVESGLEALDKMFRNARLAVLPQRHTPGAFDQVRYLNSVLDVLLLTRIIKWLPEHSL
jgi:hypothetical protein